MTETSVEAAQARVARDSLAAADALGAAAAAESKAVEASSGAYDALQANADARAELRQQADKRQLQMAMRDLAEGVRGVIRVAPLTALVVGMAAGMMLRSRKRRRTPPRRA